MTAHYRCRKCGMFPSEHSGSGYCSGAFDPFHTVGTADLVRVPGEPDRTMTAEDFVRLANETPIKRSDANERQWQADDVAPSYEESD